MKSIMLFFLMVFIASASITIAPGINLYKLPFSLPQNLEWKAHKMQLNTSPLGVWMLGQNNIYRLDKPSKALMIPLHVSSFALSQSGHIVAIVDEHLGIITQGLFMPSLKLPEKGYSIAQGANDTLYLYHTQRSAPIYHFDGSHVIAIAHPKEAIQALTHSESTLIFATKEGLFSLESGKPLGLLMPFLDTEPIQSIALNADTGELFLGTQEAIYNLANGLMAPLVTGVGGIVVFYDGCLWIADSSKHQLYIILPSQEKTGP